MYRTTLKTASRPAVAGLRAQALRSAPRRFASTSPADKSRSWKGSALRWGLAGAAVYYYSTSSVFAEDVAPAERFSSAPSSFAESSESTSLPTVQSIVEERRSQAAAAAAAAEKAAAEKKPSKEEPKGDSAAAENTAAIGSPAGLEEEADQQGAFNPETGEINWDCPCLGGMAHGPCGEEFKTAFSCFVYSNEEPKGMECIDKFQGMQECFRQYPEIYGAELAEADDEEGAPQGTPASLEQNGETQTLRDDHQIAEKQAAEKQTTDATAAPVPATETTENKEPKKEAAAPAAAATETKETEKKETKAADETPDAAPVVAAPEAKSAAAESQGPKWEDATAANEAVAQKD